ncbi:MAG: DotU family type IV/VI secretion system protein [Sedimentisphaerales bacterium]|nr:DotU family type IV/VI secretion system protein [Sedimentisphaerales bacterium]
MRLVSLCEPLFQYVCRLKRSAVKGCTLPLERVRADVQQLFEDIRIEASRQPDLVAQYERIKLPLVFFVDFVIRESTLSFRTDWVPLASDFHELAGDEKFFELLESDLADSSDAATERLAVYYTCLGLGFTGLYTGDPDTIRRLTGRISGRISRFMDADARARICPQAYEHTDTHNFTEPAGTNLGLVGTLVAGGLAVWFVLYFLFFYLVSSTISAHLDAILKMTVTKG